MPIYLFWGEDEFAMSQEIEKLRSQTVDPTWAQFNDQKIPGDRDAEAVLEALNQALTPAFGMGNRFVWLVDTTIFQQANSDLLAELGRSLPQLPPTSTLLLTTPKKPDGRSKITKLLQKHAEVKEFGLIPPWKTEELVQKVREVAGNLDLKLTPQATEILAEAIGNDTRRLWNELEKLKLYSQSSPHPLDETVVSRLVVANTQNSLQLAAALRQGQTAVALSLIAELLNQNEPALKIVATLVNQFRLWLIVRVWLDKGERDDKIIANAADISNPKRLYFIRKEIQGLSTVKLGRILPILLDLEVTLKKGGNPYETLQTKAIAICQIVSS
ncbi:MAG: DNA polymerase III subunit delta [Jaaginema sp. PMC 1080.18]|nr:DNA polymerase III subunit delta [Jaaginema sp. PMC 1080.18]MEC4867214.1 DNA polymerase III subunit delta [Jaaginema sp. PMC 1078.18]